MKMTTTDVEFFNDFTNICSKTNGLQLASFFCKAAPQQLSAV